MLNRRSTIQAPPKTQSRRSEFDDSFHWLTLNSNPPVWTYCHTQEKFFDFRMVAIKLVDGSLLVYSPLPVASPMCWEQLSMFGQVSCIIAPSHFHNLGVKPLLERFPNAKLFAAPAAAKRLKKVTGLTFFDCAQLEGLLPNGLAIKQPEGLKTGDLWLTIKNTGDRGPMLVVCDSFFNMTRPKKAPLRYS